MNTLQLTTSIKKEVWEYKRIFVWLPAIIASLIILAPLIGILLIDGSLTAYILNDNPNTTWAGFWQQIAEVQHDKMFNVISFSFSSMLFVPFLLIATLVQLYYFIACLFDERRDLSVLFWRSLPVSDGLTVGVKLLVGAIILPGFFLLAATLTLALFLILAFIFTMIMAVGYDISLWGLWGSSNIFSHMMTSWLNLLPYTLWMLPLYAWLMLVSMFSSKAPFLWAIIPVVIVLLVEAFIVHYFNLDSQILLGLLTDYFSISENNVNHYLHDQSSISLVPMKVISSKISIFGITLSAVFLYATYWLRANRSHH
ncbi:hypothetical protein [Litorilituus lipolyticus]|uniref:Uncharacterized protein n=1 Tax=Litorilituus lipolyticus TaxID=2491017 RepID=A0A502L2E1_9GAMM|nr:hypothetical protein [Litorilituus lipolyticus]TPH18150.1 hypothetical protein EPA86_03295 [Litorilituus lipolyticus]